MRFTRDTIERLANLGIHQVDTSGQSKRQYVRCPQCVEFARHAYNRRARKLAVDIREDHQVRVGGTLEGRRKGGGGWGPDRRCFPTWSLTPKTP
jgi:hypothetical protein